MSFFHMDLNLKLIENGYRLSRVLGRFGSQVGSVLVELEYARVSSLVQNFLGGLCVWVSGLAHVGCQIHVQLTKWRVWPWFGAFLVALGSRREDEVIYVNYLKVGKL